MNRKEIMERLGVGNWSAVVAAFDHLESDEIASRVDAMFPGGDSRRLAKAIDAALDQTRRCILASEIKDKDADGCHEIAPNAKLEAWIDVVNDPDVNSAIPVAELRGWGRWAWTYQVQRGTETLIYFVDATPDVTE